MRDVTLSQVRARCSEGRFFAYDDWRDRLFVPPSILLVWVFVRFGWTGNGVSYLSGAVALIGAFCLATADPLYVLLGSFGYMAFYLLDYVDGGVARFNGEAGMSGQYMDSTMHAVSAVGVAAGLFAGALSVAGSWIIPFGVLTVVAATLALDRYSFAWFTICMHYQQQRVKGLVKEPSHDFYKPRKRSLFYRAIRNLSTAVFHENYAIFLLPLLALTHLILSPSFFDFRVMLIVLGGILYFPVMICEIWLMATEGRVDHAYRKLFFSEQTPRLPEDHFLP